MIDISVTIPVYNVEPYLRRCLNSILNQTFKGKYEIICVDDGSVDKSKDILLEYAKKYPEIIKVILQENRGLSEARNTAMKFVKGKYTMFVDSDDFIAINALEKLYEYAEKHNSEVVVFDFLRGAKGDKNLKPQHFENIAQKYGNKTFSADSAEPFVYRFFAVATWCKFYLTELIKDIKFETGLNNQDVCHWAEVYTKAKRINYYPVPFYFYVMRRKNAITQNKDRKVFDVFKAFEIAENTLRKNGYFEKLKEIHYTHFSSNLINISRKIYPELRQEFIELVKKQKMDIDYDSILNQDFFDFEKRDVLLVKFIKDNSFDKIEKFYKEKKMW